MTERIAPVHPGEILKEEYIEPLGISQYLVAKATGVPPRRINEILHGRKAISADTALRLARFLGTTPEFWLNLQVRFDLERTRDRIGRAIEEGIVPLTR